MFNRTPRAMPVPEKCPNCRNTHLQFHSLSIWCLRCGWGKNRYSDADMKKVRRYG